MAGMKDALARRMHLVILQLEQQGSLDYRFRDTIQLKQIQGPYFFANLLPTFLTDTNEALRDLTNLMYRVAEGACALDFHAVDQGAIKLRGATSSLGLCRMAHSCLALHRAAGSRNRLGCAVALNELRHEFSRIINKLQEIAQLERRLVTMSG